LIPSPLVITRFPVPLLATATNNDSSGHQITEYQLLAAAAVLCTQLVPFVLVITNPLVETAQNRESRSDQQTECQLLVTGHVCPYQ
jgi:hypothetical protein